MKKKVLIVDDEAVIRIFLRKLCRSFDDVECVEASNVNEAMELFSRGDINLVISDMSMPGETGLHLLENVKSSGRAVPFIIYSGSVTPEEEAKLTESGANIVLSKSVEPIQVKNAILDLLGVAF